MEPIGLLVFIGVAFLIGYSLLRGLATGVGGLAPRAFKSYRLLAKRYQGKYEPRGISDTPTVSFSHNGSNVRVGLAPTVQGQPNTPRTRVVARFPKGVPFRMELVPQGRVTSRQPPKGTRAVLLDDPSFDKFYVLHANDPEVARDVFRADARRAIENLRRMAPPVGMLISISPERMLTQVDRNLAPQAELLNLAVRESLVLHDAVRSSIEARLAEGVTIQVVGAPEDGSGPPLCRVCGESIDDHVKRVVCAGCKTPHHADCWEFAGGCSVFGCQSKRAAAV